MSDRVRQFLDSLSSAERKELFDMLLCDHFAVGEQEVAVVRPVDEAIVGYLTSPGIRLAHLTGIDPNDAPPEFAGPHFRGGHGARMLERMTKESEALAESPARS